MRHADLRREATAVIAKAASALLYDTMWYTRPRFKDILLKETPRYKDTFFPRTWCPADVQ